MLIPTSTPSKASPPCYRHLAALEPAVRDPRAGSRSLTNRHLEPHEPAPRASRTAGSRPEAEPAKQIHGTNRPDSSDKSTRFTALIHPIHGANPIDKNLYCVLECIFPQNAFCMETVCVLAQNGGRFDTKRKAFWHKTENVLAQNTDGMSKYIIHPNYKMKLSRDVVKVVNFITATKIKDSAEFTLPKYQKI